MNTALVVIIVPIVWVWVTVTIVNSVAIVQQCAPKVTVLFVKIVLGRFVIAVVNVPFVHLTYFVTLVEIVANVLVPFVGDAIIAAIVQRFAKDVGIVVVNVKTYVKLVIDAKLVLV